MQEGAKQMVQRSKLSLHGQWRRWQRDQRIGKSRTRRVGRRYMLGRLAKGTMMGVLGASGIGTGYLMTRALMGLALQASGKNVLPELNAAQIFTNPHNGKEGILIHLSDGAFVAYDRACTHSKVYVDYDSKTQTLICPAHQAIFDPAQGARVVSGPAPSPLPKMAIQMKSDGTFQVAESGAAPFEHGL
jgi:nitrite reductase/ring-hydroxylating ferredoxin subunit